MPMMRRLPWIQRAARPDDARQREAVDELHPQADDAVVPIDAVDGDHVRVPDARQQPSFLDDFSRPRGSAQQFQGDVSLQRVVPGEIHGAEVALADRAAKQQRPPLGQGVVPRFVAMLAGGDGGSRCTPARAATTRSSRMSRFTSALAAVDSAEAQSGPLASTMAPAN